MALPPQCSLILVYLISLLFNSSIADSASSNSVVLSAHDPSCSSGPLVIPIRNVTLSDGTLRRGAALSIGTPPQPMAFTLNGDLNNTYIYDGTVPFEQNGCSSNNSRAECSDQFGGLFNEGTSTTWSPVANSSVLDTASESEGINPNHATDLWGTDTMNLNSSLSIPKFPLGISRDEGEPMNTLGFGHNSTLLNILALNGSIASRTWSFWQGWTGAQTQYQMDGSLVLGGYDSAKVTGQNITVPLNMSDLNCNLVNVTDIKMNLKNGSSPSLFAPFGLSRVLGCPEPHFGTVFLHSDMWDLFLEISGSTYVDRSVSSVNFYGMLVETFGAYDGDLTISIDPGLDIRIPNHQLVVPDYDINDQGQQYIKNSSNREILINQMSSNGANDNIVLGLPFFTSAYMLVDNDAQSMTLWQAQASKTQNIVPFGHPPACETTVSSHSNLPIPDPTKPTTIHSAITSSAISKGAIAGAVVGGLIGIALFICAYIWFRMRQNRRRQAAETSAQSFLAPYPYESGYQKPEMPSDRHPPQEMPLDRDPGFALAPYEMSEVRAYEELPAQRFAMELPLHGPPTPEKSRPLTLVEISGGPKTPKSRRGSRF